MRQFGEVAAKPSSERRSGGLAGDDGEFLDFGRRKEEDLATRRRTFLDMVAQKFWATTRDWKVFSQYSPIVVQPC
jgi:hypothetical protein